MPFLFPYLLSGVCDVLILVLQEHRRETLHLQLLSNNSTTPSDDDSTSDSSSVVLAVHGVVYLSVLCCMRLLLWLFPLPYHSYTGTAIRFPVLYHLFYGGTLMAVLLHMLALSMMDPDSIATLTETSRSSSIQDRLNQTCWWILFLSLMSVMSHIVMLIHVRSTAPSINYLTFQNYNNNNKNKKTKLVYYFNQWRKVNVNLNVKQQQQSKNDKNDTNTATMAQTETEPPQTPKQDYKNGTNNSQIEDTPSSPNSLLFPQNLLTAAPYEEFMTEMQTQISLLQQDWTNKLEDFTQRHLQGRGTNISNSTTNNPLLPLTPFRVLLQLFAYQNVIDSGKLDAVFDKDPKALTFFVPQLLSFLLHGAYYETDPTKLEQWILAKCRTNIHFAHRCYWFLRAWSLEQQTAAPSILYTGSSPRNSMGSLTTPPPPATSSTTPSHRRNPSSGNDLQVDPLAVSLNHNPPPTADAHRRSRSNSFSSLANGNSNNVIATKLSPEERAVVEGLLLKVVQRAEPAARILQYGQSKQQQQFANDSSSSKSRKKKKRRGKREKVQPKQAQPSQDGIFWDTDEEGGTSSATSSPMIHHYNHQNSNINASEEFNARLPLVLTPEMEAALPLDPNTGFPSQRHVQAITVSQRYGFVPLATARQERQSLPTTNSSPLGDALFQGTPRFLDALLGLADGLFLVPREHRKRELQRQLQALEVELLPSNAVYVPISNVYHRVWRIVAEESIALNTKERVPCIILLEVVDYETDDHEDTQNSNDDDDEDEHDNHSGSEETERLILGAGNSNKRKHKKESKRSPLELPKLGLPKKKKRSPLEDSDAQSTSSSAAFSLPYYTMMGGMTETEIVHRWRFAKRDPHRGESILEKIMTLDHLKEKIHRHKTPILHDLLTLTDEHHRSGKFTATTTRTHSDTEEDEEMAAILRSDNTAEGTKMLQAASSAAANDMENGTAARAESPERQESSAETMGQWQSPTSADRRTVTLDRQHFFADDKAESSNNNNTNMMNGASSLESRQQDNNSNSSTEGKLAYGSTYYEGRGRPPRATTPVDGGSNNTRGGVSNNNSNNKARNSSSPYNGHGNNYNYNNHTTAATKSQPQQVVFRENWQAKEDRLRKKSAFGSHRGWRVLPILVKANDDLRQEQLASQLIQRMAFILARERVPVWLCPYEIIAITDRGGIVEAIPDTISLDSLKRNSPNFVDLQTFFLSFFGDNVDELADAKSNFVESLAGYSIVTFLLQIKDRHNGNILLDNRGHIIHIDFGFFFLSSPGKNTGFESAPFKLTRDFVEVLGGPESQTFRTFRELCVRSFLVLRRHCMEIILLVEMLKSGNEDLACFRGRPDDAIRELRQRFRLDLSDRACKEYVHSLIDESLENWRTNWYDRYQRYCVGVL